MPAGIHTSSCHAYVAGLSHNRRGSVHHIDMYRCQNSEDASSAANQIGLSEALHTGACLIEWPDCLGETLPKAFHVHKRESHSALSHALFPKEHLAATVREAPAEEAVAVAWEPHSSCNITTSAVLTFFNDDNPGELSQAGLPGADEIDEDYVRVVQLAGCGPLWAERVHQICSDADLLTGWGLRLL